MSINETKPATSLLIDLDQVSLAEIQNRFGSKHEVISNLQRGKHITILVVETSEIVSGNAYAILEDTLKNQFGVTALQTVFDVTVPGSNVMTDHAFDLHISGHLRARAHFSD